MRNFRPIASLAETSPYDGERDVALYAMTEPSTRLHATPGTVAIFFPSDGHVPGVALDATVSVRKVVLKVLLD